MAFSKKEDVITITALKMETVQIPIIGITELIVNNWSEKAKELMRKKQAGEVVTKQKRNPEEEYLAARYLLDDGSHGFRAGGFKAAIVGACRNYKGLPMTVAKIAIFVEGIQTKDGEQLVKIEGESHMRTDMVRLESGVADLRYRPGYWPWKAVLTITHNASLISTEQLYNLVNAAGYGGIGEWRPSAPKVMSGNYGRFQVVVD